MMRYTLVGLGLGLMSTLNSVQAQTTVTVKVPVGTCAPGAYQGSAAGGAPGSGLGSGSGSGSYVVTNTRSGCGKILAHSIHSVQPTLGETVDSSYGSYTLDGAYDTGSSGYILDGASTTASDMTLDHCASFCKGTPYFALQNGRTSFPSPFSTLAYEIRRRMYMRFRSPDWQRCRYFRVWLRNCCRRRPFRMCWLCTVWRCLFLRIMLLCWLWTVHCPCIYDYQFPRIYHCDVHNVSSSNKRRSKNLHYD